RWASHSFTSPPRDRRLVIATTDEAGDAGKHSRIINCGRQTLRTAAGSNPCRNIPDIVRSLFAHSRARRRGLKGYGVRGERHWGLAHQPASRTRGSKEPTNDFSGLERPANVSDTLKLSPAGPPLGRK